MAFAKATTPLQEVFLYEGILEPYFSAGKAGVPPSAAHAGSRRRLKNSAAGLMLCETSDMHAWLQALRCRAGCWGGAHWRPCARHSRASSPSTCVTST